LKEQGVETVFWDGRNETKAAVNEVFIVDDLFIFTDLRAVQAAPYPHAFPVGRTPYSRYKYI